MGYQEEIRKQQLLDRINIIKQTLPIPEKDAVEPIKKSLFDEFEVADVETIEKSLNVIGDILGEEAVNDIEKAISHKYFKREGTKGNYRYYYTEADYKEAKGKDTAPSIEPSDGGLSEIESLKIKIIRAKEQNPGKVPFLQERLKELESKDLDKKRISAKNELVEKLVKIGHTRDVANDMVENNFKNVNGYLSRSKKEAKDRADRFNSTSNEKEEKSDGIQLPDYIKSFKSKFGISIGVEKYGPKEMLVMHFPKDDQGIREKIVTELHHNEDLNRDLSTIDSIEGKVVFHLDKQHGKHNEDTSLGSKIK